MTDSLFARAQILDFQDDALRNIPTIRAAQDLYDDLSANPADWPHAIAFELSAKAPGREPAVLYRPYDEAHQFNAIDYPFTRWQESRYSDGRYGVWYGAERLETTVHETVYHWKRRLAAAEGFLDHAEPIIAERRVYRVRITALLLDLRGCIDDYPALVDPGDYSFTHEIGRRIHREGHPGLTSRSARCDGTVYAIFKDSVLSNARTLCELTYTLKTATGRITVKRGAKVVLTL